MFWRHCPGSRGAGFNIAGDNKTLTIVHSGLFVDYLNYWTLYTIEIREFLISINLRKYLDVKVIIEM